MFWVSFVYDTKILLIYIKKITYGKSKDRKLSKMFNCYFFSKCTNGFQINTQQTLFSEKFGRTSLQAGREGSWPPKSLTMVAVKLQLKPNA